MFGEHDRWRHVVCGRIEHDGNAHFAGGLQVLVGGVVNFVDF